MNTRAEQGTPTREHLTVFMQRRSLTALVCGILSLIFAFYGIIAGVDLTITVLGENAFLSFNHFTMASNLFAALSVAFVFPYTVEGIRRKRFILPKWLAVMHYLATSSIAIVMVFVLAFMSWAHPEGAFGNSNLVTHVICPLLILLSFFQMENGHLLTWKDCLLGCAPFCVYLIVYAVEVLVIGKANGGWEDIYHIQDYASPAFAIPALLLLAFGVSAAIALVSNALTRRRKEKMFQIWHDGMDPIEVRIEAYGLGRMAGQYGEPSSIQIPYDILAYLAERYHLNTEDVVQPFIKSLLIELRERDRTERGADMESGGHRLR